MTDNDPVYDQRIRDDQRMIDLLWDQRRELVTLMAHHSSRFVKLALTIKRELQDN